MVNLNLRTGNVDPSNDGLISGALKDGIDFTDRSLAQTTNVFTPSTSAVIDNTLMLLRKPLDTLGTGKNYLKFLGSIAALPADLVAKAVRFPFSRLDDALNYTINNNLERGLEAVKSVSTQGLANFFTNNGKTSNPLLKAAGGLTAGTGDLLTSAIKLPTWALAKGTSIVDTALAQATKWTEGNIDKVRISEDSFFKWNLASSSLSPEQSNAEMHG